MLPRLRTRIAATATALAATAALLLAAPATAAPTATADVGDFEFESMHVDYHLDRAADGTAQLRAVETLVAVFPEFDQNRGIVRDIPTEYRRVPIGVTIVSVTDDAGRAVPYERSAWTDADGTDFVSLALGTDAFVHGRTTYVIEWTAHDVVATFDDGQEFYWDVNGTGWGQRFGSVTATLHLSPDLRDAFDGRTACFFGYAGETASCEITTTADGFELDAGELFAGQNASLVVGFAAGTFRPGTPVDATWPFTVLPWVLLGTLVVGAVLVVVGRTRIWVHAPGRGVIIPEYEGPDDLGVMAATRFTGKRAAAFPAQLVRFAVEGVASLVEDPDEPEHRRYRLDIHDPSKATDDDASVLRSLAGENAKAGRSLVLDKRNRKLGDKIASLIAVRSAIPAQRGYLERAKKGALNRVIFWIGLLGVLGGAALFVLGLVNDVVSVLLTVATPVLILGGIVVMGFSGTPERRTAKGTAAWEQLQGLRDYLQLAEADRLRVLQSPQGAVRSRIDPGDTAEVVKLYERLLPWAIVWGVEKDWAKVLEANYSETVPPTTSLPTSSVFAGTFATTFATSSFAQTVVSSSSSGSGFSSSSSGFSSGGGFSGGGGGGGGGGGR